MVGTQGTSLVQLQNTPKCQIFPQKARNSGLDEEGSKTDFGVGLICNL